MAAVVPMEGTSSGLDALSQKTKETLFSQYMEALEAPRPMPPEEILQYNRRTQVLISQYQYLQVFLDSARDAKLLPVFWGVAHDVGVLRTIYQAQFPRTFRINDLPHHILAVILGMSITGGDSPLPVTSTEMIRRTQLISSTCRLWRKLTLSDPMCWSRITFDDAPHFTRSLLYLKRAGNVPKSIRILSTRKSPITLEHIQQIAPKIASQISTIRSLILDIPDCESLFKLWSMLSSVVTPSTPLVLRRLHVFHKIRIRDHWKCVSEPANDPAKLLFGGRPIPTLSQLWLISFPIEFASSPGALSNLVYLTLRNTPEKSRPSIPAFVAVLKAMPKLSKLILLQPPCDLSAPHSGPAATLPGVRSLWLGDFQYSSCHRLLTIIHTPNVSELFLSGLKGVKNASDHHFFTALSTACQPEAIESLVLRNMHDFSIPDNFVNHGHINFISRLRSLQVLRLGPGIVSSEAFYPFILDTVTKAELKVGDSTTNVPAPKLTGVALAGHVDVDFFSQWLRTRRGIGHAITRLTVDKSIQDEYCDDVFLEMEEALRQGPGPHAELSAIITKDPDEFHICDNDPR